MTDNSKPKPKVGRSRKGEETIIQRRREHISDLLHKGCSVKQIMQETGLSQGIVYKHIRKINEVHQKRYVDRIEETKRQEIAHLQYVKRRIWEWIEAECKPLGKNTPQALLRTPDPALISRLLKCSELILKSMGVFTEKEGAGSPGNTYNIIMNVWDEIANGRWGPNPDNVIESPSSSLSHPNQLESCADFDDTVSESDINTDTDTDDPVERMIREAEEGRGHIPCNQQQQPEIEDTYPYEMEPDESNDPR